jgi:hypothetical protein
MASLLQSSQLSGDCEVDSLEQLQWFEEEHCCQSEKALPGLFIELGCDSAHQHHHVDDALVGQRRRDG